ncbi:hypothetical protein HZS_2211, partial [Henneguya salminicola]
LTICPFPHIYIYIIAQNIEMAPNFDRGCPAALIAKNNEISERAEHNCESNRLVIQIPAENLSPESFVDTLIFEKASQLNLYTNQIFLYLLITMRYQIVNTPYSILSKSQFIQLLESSGV